VEIHAYSCIEVLLFVLRVTAFRFFLTNTQMPTLSASDYTTFIKVQAASLAYANGRVPTTIQTRDQPYPNQSVLNAQLLGSQAAALLTPRNTTLRVVNGQIQRVRPYDGMGPVNQPKRLSTVAQSGTLSSAKFRQVGGLPLTAPKSSGTYAPVTQLARVDTKATGAYAASIPRNGSTRLPTLQGGTST
jgi:hypothetical protein